MRGNPLPLRRSLRTRAAIASASAFLVLSAVVCGILPHSYGAQARARLHREAADLCRGLALATADIVPDSDAASTPTLPPDAALAAWAAAHPKLDSVLLIDSAGGEIARWPADSFPWTGAAPTAALVETASHVMTARPLRYDDPSAPLVAVRVSTTDLGHDLENVGWLFLAVFLFTGGVFVVLTGHLTRSVLEPLDDIGQAATSLAYGDTVVQRSPTGDPEIDALGDLIVQLARRHRPGESYGWGARRAAARPSVPVPTAETPGPAPVDEETPSPLVRAES